MFAGPPNWSLSDLLSGFFSSVLVTQRGSDLHPQSMTVEPASVGDGSGST